MSIAPCILLIDDDAVFVQALARSLQRRGFVAFTAGSAADALQQLDEIEPTHAVLDLMLGSDDGLQVLDALLQARPALKVLLLTGYASLATAVDAIKRGADNYLAKPTDAAGVLAALGLAQPTAAAVEAPRPLAWKRLEWEHLQRVLADHQGNIAATARALGMHRRTLQRKLRKRPSGFGD